MMGAMEADLDNFFGINKAVDGCKLTLKDRLSGKVVHGSRSGPTPAKRKTNLSSFC